jgi:hypothetical protein
MISATACSCCTMRNAQPVLIDTLNVIPAASGSASMQTAVIPFGSSFIEDMKAKSSASCISRRILRSLLEVLGAYVISRGALGYSFKQVSNVEFSAARRLAFVYSSILGTVYRVLQVARERNFVVVVALQLRGCL